VGDEPARRTAIESDEERERRRRASLGALAQSYAPRGLADVLKLSPEGRARARAQWRARPRRERVWMWAVLAVDAVLMGALFVGVVSRDGALVVIAGGVLVAFMLVTFVISMVAELRHGSRRR
jgi:hypothetical protein